MCGSTAVLRLIVFVWPSLLIGLAAMPALLSRTRLSQALGGTSFLLLAFAAVAVPPETAEDWFHFGLYACPGMLGIFANRAGRRKRPQPGHCAQCGYNLTGNVSGICPECGTKIVPP